MTPTVEEFARWRDDSVTGWVFKALARNAEECRQTWDSASWGHGHANPTLLTEMRTRADALRSIIDADYEAFCQTLGEEPIYDR